MEDTKFTLLQTIGAFLVFGCLFVWVGTYVASTVGFNLPEVPLIFLGLLMSIIGIVLLMVGSSNVKVDPEAERKMIKRFLKTRIIMYFISIIVIIIIILVKATFF